MVNLATVGSRLTLCSVIFHSYFNFYPSVYAVNVIDVPNAFPAKTAGAL